MFTRKVGGVKHLPPLLQCSVPHGIALTSHEPTDPSELPYEVHMQYLHNMYTECRVSWLMFCANLVVSVCVLSYNL